MEESAPDVWSKIIEGREGGRYETPEDLVRVNGIGEKTLARIRIYLSIDSGQPD